MRDVRRCKDGNCPPSLLLVASVDVETGAAGGMTEPVSSWPTEYDCDLYVLGVGCRGIEKGIPVSPGDGRTSCSLKGGSLRLSWLQIVPHGYAVGVLLHAVAPGAVIDVHGICSVPGVPGSDVDGLYGPVMDGFRLMLEAVTSFNQEVRRPHRADLAVAVEFVILTCSNSSSDDASASESGVDRRRPGFDFSRSSVADACGVPKVPKAGMAVRVVMPDLLGGLLMPSLELGTRMFQDSLDHINVSISLRRI